MANASYCILWTLVRIYPFVFSFRVEMKIGSEEAQEELITVPSLRLLVIEKTGNLILMAVNTSFLGLSCPILLLGAIIKSGYISFK